MSIACYWANCPDEHLRDLLWIARHLKPRWILEESAFDRQQRVHRYNIALEEAFRKARFGRWKGQHVRTALDGVMDAYDVRVPTCLF